VSTIFPRWINALPTVLAGGTVSTLGLVVGGFWYYATPKFYDVGYMPRQPGGGFNHQIHAGTLGMDCRYCHTKVEDSSEANIPNVATCQGCHGPNKLRVLAESPLHAEKTSFIREAYAENKSIEWNRIHKLPDYVRNFPHAAHLNAGVSCYSCHGNIMRQPVVWQNEPLSMGWCLDCHREPDKHILKPNADGRTPYTKLFDVEASLMPDKLAARTAEGKKQVDERRLNPPQGCGACHY